MTTKRFITPFAESGIKAPIADVPSGTDVNYLTGYTPEYALDPLTNPNARFVEITNENQILNDITGNIKHWQENTFPEFITPASNGGVAFEYKKGDTVLYDGVAYESLEDSNEDLPTTSKWVVHKPNEVLRAILIAQGYSGNYGFFKNGFAYNFSGDIGIDTDGSMWTYADVGALPVTIAAGAVPSEGVYNEITGIKSSTVINEDGTTVQEFIDSTKVNYPFKSSTEVDIVIVYGQSNARGFADNSAGDLTYASPLAKVWDGSGAIDLTSYTPTQNGGTSTGSAWKAFGNRYTQETSRQVIIANCARGSQSITDLSKGQANTNYSGMVDWVADIKSYITSNGGTVGKVFVVFHQGERDSQLETTKIDYEALLTTLWNDIKADTGAETFFLCPVGYYASGQQKIYAFAIQAAQRNLAATVYDIQNCWDDMESMGEYKPDGVHLNQLGNNYMGDEIAKNVVDSLFNQNVAANIETIKRKGAPNMDGSQDWKVFGGWITKEGSDWVVTNGTSRASCYVVSVVAESDHLAVTLSEQVDYIFGGYVHSLERSGRASVDGRFDRQAYEDVDSEGRTVLKMYLETPVSLVVDTDAETISTSIPDSSIAGMMTATFGTGSCSLTHPYAAAPAVACDRSGVDNEAVLVSCNSFETATTIRLRNPIPDETTGNIVRKEGSVTVNWPRMRLNPQLMADGSELTFSMTASKKSPF